MSDSFATLYFAKWVGCEKGRDDGLSYFLEDKVSAK